MRIFYSYSATDSSDFTLSGTFTIPPERSSVDIVMDIQQNSVVEDDETVNVTLTASATGIFLSNDERTRMVTVNILDNDGKRVFV